MGTAGMNEYASGLRSSMTLAWQRHTKWRTDVDVTMANTHIMALIIVIVMATTHKMALTLVVTMATTHKMAHECRCYHGNDTQNGADCCYCHGNDTQNSADCSRFPHTSSFICPIL